MAVTCTCNYLADYRYSVYVTYCSGSKSKCLLCLH